MIDISFSQRNSSLIAEPWYRYEADGNIGNFEIEIPGVTKENVNIEVDGHKLVVVGRRFKKQLVVKQNARESGRGFELTMPRSPRERERAIGSLHCNLLLAYISCEQGGENSGDVDKKEH